MDSKARRESKRISKDIRKASQMTTKQLEAAKAEEEKKSKKIVKTTFVSQNAGWKRLFSLYKPQWVIAVMVILAALNSLGMPVTARCIIVL